DEDERPRLVLDAGTGLQRMSKSFAGEAFVGTILLGHLHWDHTHGLPFFPPGYHPDAKVTLLLPEQGEDAEELLGRAFSPPHVPIWPRQRSSAPNRTWGIPLSTTPSVSAGRRALAR